MCLSEDRFPVFLADTLISSTSGRSDIALPTIGKPKLAQTTANGLKPHGATSKLVRISDSLMVAWAGEVCVAEKILRGLQAIFGELPPTERDLLAFFNAEYWDEITAKRVSMIFGIREGAGIKIRTFNCWRVELPDLGWVWVAGSGSDQGLAVLKQAQAMAAAISDIPQRILATAVATGAMLLASEIATGSTLVDNFGGAYEIAYFAENKFQNFHDYACVFWFVSKDSNGTRFSPFKIIRSFAQEGMICMYCCQLGSESGALKWENEEVFLISSVLSHVPKKIGFHCPDMNAKLQANLWFGNSSADRAIGGLFTYRDNGKKHPVMFVVEKSQVKLALDFEQLKPAFSQFAESK